MQPLSDAELDVLLQARADGRYFADLKILESGIFESKKIKPGASVVSANYFLLHATTEFQGHRYSVQSLLRRKVDEPARVDVVARTYGEW